MAFFISPRNVSRCAGSTIDTGLFFQSCWANTVSTPRWRDWQSFRTRATSASDHAAYCVSDSTDWNPAWAASSNSSSIDPLSISSIKVVLIPGLKGAAGWPWAARLVVRSPADCMKVRRFIAFRLPPLPSEAIQPAVLRTNHHAPRGYRRRSRQWRAGFEIPKLLSGGQIEHVEMAVVGAYVHPAVRYGGGRIDARLAGERPDGLAGSGVQAMDQLVPPAQNNAVAGRGGRGVERELGGLPLVSPAYAFLAHAGAHHFIVEIAEPGPLAEHRRRSGGRAARGKLHHLLAVRQADSVEDFIAAGDIDRKSTRLNSSHA